MRSREREPPLRSRISTLKLREDDGRTSEEKYLWAQYERCAGKENDRSRERDWRKKEEIDRILAKPDKKRTKIEPSWKRHCLAKTRKNEGDRLRRQRFDKSQTVY
jgi:hypothetical protein